MVEKNKAEIASVQLKIQGKLAKRYKHRAAIAAIDADVQALESYLAYLTGKTVGEISVSKSLGDHLAEILRNKGRPMHVKDLLENLRQLNPGLAHTALQTVTGILIRNSNKKKRFKRIGPNIYDILEENDG